MMNETNVARALALVPAAERRSERRHAALYAFDMAYAMRRSSLGNVDYIRTTNRLRALVAQADETLLNLRYWAPTF